MRVLMVPANRSSELVEQCLRGWSRAGLLEPFAWRSVSSTTTLDDATRVTRIELGSTQELLLGAALQDFDRADHELIAFYPATATEGFEAGFADLAGGFVHLLARTIAHDPNRPARCTMVIAPAQIGQPVPPTLVRHDFASNIYVAPEDRCEPRDPNRLLGNEEVFPMHAAHAIATVAELWNGPSSGDHSVIDLLAERQPRNQRSTQIVRCFSRGVDFGYLPDHVSAGIFHAGGGWPNPDQDKFDRIADPQTIVPHLAKNFMDLHRAELGLSPFTPHTLPEPKELGLFEAFKLLVELLIQRIRRKPFELVRERFDSIHDSIAGWVEEKAGPDSGIKVRRRGRAGSGDDAVELDEVLDRPLIVPDGAVSEAWTDLRQLVLGLVDGSELPEGLDQTRLLNGKGQRALVTDAAALVPNPEADPPPVAEFAEGPICDPLRLDPTFVAEAPESVGEKLANWVASHRSALLWQVGSKISADLQTAIQEAQPASAAEPKPGDAAEDDEEKGDRERQPPTAEERKTLRGRLRKSLFLSSVIAVIATVLAVTQLAVIAFLVVLLAILGLWFLAFASAARRWFLAEEAITRRSHEEHLARLNAASKRSLRMGDEIRLTRRYREYLAWAEILGWLVHKPWVGDPLDHVELSPPIDHGSLPAAFSMSVADISLHGLERLSATTGVGVFGPGWLSSLYDNVERLEMREIGIRQGLSSDDAESDLADPAADTSQDPERPRERMLDAVRTGRHRALTGSELSDEVLRHIGGLGPDALCDRVVILPTADGAAVGEEVDALPPPLIGFEPPRSLSRLITDLAPAVVRIECKTKYREFGGTGVVVGEKRLVATADDVVSEADSIAMVTADGKRLEATLKSRNSKTGIAFLALEESPELPGVDLADPADVAQGDAVACIGRPFAEHHEPVVAWGLVTASERSAPLPGQPRSHRPGPYIQMAYNRAEAPAGAPVFNMEGELVGVHHGQGADQAADLRNQRPSSAIPVSAVAEQLQAHSSGDEPRPKAGQTMPPTREATTAASEFLEELTRMDAPALLGHHWEDAETKNEIKETIPPPEQAAAQTTEVGNLAANLEFFSPLRILVHRVDLVAPSNVVDLASFAGDEDEASGPDEKIAGDNF